MFKSSDVYFTTKSAGLQLELKVVVQQNFMKID